MAPTKEIVRVGVQVNTNLLIQELRNIILLGKSRQHKRRRFWICNWIKRRNQYGVSETLLRELALEDPEGYSNHLRMCKEKFEGLLSKIGPKIQKQDTVMRKALPAALKLQITLRYLATGDPFATLAFMYRVSKNTISNFIKPVCEEVYEVLQEFIKVPQTEEEWKEIQSDFYNRWNFPNCCGALDGKHIVIRNAPHSGSEYFNYKGTSSVILFASVDANYCLSYIDVGTNARTNDAAVFSNSSLNAALQANMLNFPKNGVFLADDAFPLKTFILKPYGRTTCLSRKQKIFNYRLSRARRIVENAFGILVSRYRIFEKPIPLTIDKVDILVKTASALHNWMRTTSSEKYTAIGSLDVEYFNAGTIIPGSWRSEIHGANGIQAIRNSIGSRNYTTEAASRRDKYADFFSSRGAVPWQENMIHDDNIVAIII